MTDGTSQGLFIVVAIVIFGIFISLSYTVFGSMGDGVHGLMDTALNRTHLQLINGEVIYSKDFHVGTSRTNSEGRTPGGYVLGADLFEQGGSYTLTFDLEVTEGTLKAIRGHLHTSSDVKIYIDGVRTSQTTQDWRTFVGGFVFDEPYEVGDVVSFKLVFDTDRYENTMDGHPNKHLSITPNVDFLDGPVIHEGEDAVNYHNIKLIKHN